MMTIRASVSASRIVGFYFAAGAWAATAFGQAVAPAAASARSGTPVVLSPFEVSDRQPGRYQSAEAISGGRVRADIFDAAQSISVITREAFDDLAANRIIDVAKYVSGITESVAPTGIDRMTVRGFQVDGTTVDGFASNNQQANLDPALIERMEVVKGPNAILAPTAVPGGTVNLITRKPQFRNFGMIYVQAGQYDANRAELDWNHAFGPGNRYATRVVLAQQDSKGYPGNPRRSTTFMPMFALQTKGGARLTVQFEYFDYYAQNYQGLPLDPSSGSANDAKLLPGAARDLNIWGDDTRLDTRYEGRALLTAPLTASIDMRLAARYAHADTTFNMENPGLDTSSNATNNAGGAINPLTGFYVPGSIFPRPTFAATPAPQPTRTMPRIGLWFRPKSPMGNLQNDFVHQFKGAAVETTTLGGFAYNYYKSAGKAFLTIAQPINYDAPTPSKYTFGPANANVTSTTSSAQVYVGETAKFLAGRLVLNASYSYTNFDLTTIDRLTPIVANQRAVATAESWLRAWGAVAKPLPGVALYYGYNENASALRGSTISEGGPKLQTGLQREYGARFELLDKRLYATFAHFKILQSNFTIPNPANTAVPPPSPLLPELLADRIAKGWEVELRANLTKEFALIGNLTAFTNRDPNNVPFRGTAEKSWAVLATYKFGRETVLDQLSVSLGADHLDRRPGDAPGGFTAASTPARLIPNQPTFWLPSQTLVNVMAGYPVNKNWSVQLNLDNVLNEDYLMAAMGRTTVMVGTPRNLRARVTYRF